MNFKKCLSMLFVGSVFVSGCFFFNSKVNAMFGMGMSGGGGNSGDDPFGKKSANIKMPGFFSDFKLNIDNRPLQQKASDYFNKKELGKLNGDDVPPIYLGYTVSEKGSDKGKKIESLNDGKVLLFSDEKSVNSSDSGSKTVMFKICFSPTYFIKRFGHNFDFTKDKFSFNIYFADKNKAPILLEDFYLIGGGGGINIFAEGDYVRFTKRFTNFDLSRLQSNFAKVEVICNGKCLTLGQNFEPGVEVSLNEVSMMDFIDDMKCDIPSKINHPSNFNYDFYKDYVDIGECIS